MKPAFFDAQWLVIARRWPWHPGEEDAMRHYRERLRVRATDYTDNTLGIAVERVCARQDHGRRPSVDEIATLMRDLEPPAYEPPATVPEEERQRGRETLRGYLERRRPRWAAASSRPPDDAERDAIRTERPA